MVDTIQLTNIWARDATAADSDFIFSLKRRTLGLYIEATWGPWDEACQRRWHDEHFSPESYLIVNSDTIPIGAYKTIIRDDVLYIDVLEIAPEFQGRRIGTRIVKSILDGALDQTVKVHVLKVNQRGVTFFRRLEFYPDGHSSNHITFRHHPVRTEWRSAPELEAQSGVSKTSSKSINTPDSKENPN